MTTVEDELYSLLESLKFADLKLTNCIHRLQVKLTRDVGDEPKKVFCAVLVLVCSEDVKLEEYDQKAIDPIIDQDITERDHSKRTIFSSHNNLGWAKHVKFRGGQRPLVLGYSPLGLKYLPVGKPILLKPVRNGFRFKPRPQWKPKRIVPFIPSTPIVQNDGWKPIVPVHVPAPPQIEPKPWQEQGWGNAKPVLQGQGSTKPTIVHHVDHHVDHHVHVEQPKPVQVNPVHHVHVEQPKPVLVTPVNHVHYEPAKPVDPVILKPVQVYYPKPVLTDHAHQHVQHGNHVDDIIKPVWTDHVHQHVQHGNHVDDVVKPVVYPQQPQFIYYNPLAVPKPQLPVLPLGSAFPAPVLVPQTPVTHLHPVPTPIDVHPVVPDVHQHVHHPVVPQIPQVPHVHHQVVQQYPHLHQVVPQQVQPVVPQHLHPVAPQVPHYHQQVPQILQQVPHYHQQVPHVHQQVPHVQQQVPHIHQQVPHVHQQVPHVQPQVPQEIAYGQVPQGHQQVPNVAPTYPSYVGFPQQTVPNPTVQTPQSHPNYHAQPEATPTPTAPNYQNQLVIEYHGSKAHLIQPYSNPQYIPENYNPEILPGSDGRPTQDLTNYYRQQPEAQQYDQSIHDQTSDYYTQGRYEVAEPEAEEVQGIQPGQTDLQLPSYLPQHPNYRPEYRDQSEYQGGYPDGVDRSAQESEEDLK